MKTILLICLLTLGMTNTANAEQSGEWILAAASESGADFYINPKNVRQGLHKGEKTIQVDGKYVHPDKSVQLVIFKISYQHCDKGTGTIWTLDRAGMSLNGNDFSLRVNSTASELARKLCSLR